LKSQGGGVEMIASTMVRPVARLGHAAMGVPTPIPRLSARWRLIAAVSACYALILHYCLVAAFLFDKWRR
jgi:hypothetical protein